MSNNVSAIPMRLTPVQLEVLHMLWASDTPLLVERRSEKSKYRIVGRLIVSVVIENLLAKETVYRAVAGLQFARRVFYESIKFYYIGCDYRCCNFSCVYSAFFHTQNNAAEIPDEVTEMIEE